MHFLPETFTSSRLLFRIQTPEDSSDILQSWGHDTEVAKYLTWIPNSTLEQSMERGRAILQDFAAHKNATYLARSKNDGMLVGGLAVRPDGHMANLGYVVTRKKWGQGFGTEICKSGISISFAMNHIVRVWAVADIENPASARVMERAGMKFEGVLRGWARHPNISNQPRDVKSYSMLKGEYTET